MHLKFSQDIESLLQRLAERPLTIKDILEETSERGFSLIFFLLALPFLFPMPPGLASIIGPTSLLMALQMALGKTKPWLPRKMARFRFPHKLIWQVFTKLKKIIILVEKITRPRFLQLAHNSYIWRINGFLIAWLTILLMLPIPGTNPLPTVGILLLSIANLESDGLLMVIAYIWSFLITLFFGFLGYLLWRSHELFIS